ncbi:transcriptional regulator domain-containing protein [Granulosicoccus sp. 3-233]|uniref:transcriptional regulator domain-containing protein n=1 Tax=Granulosicoccus sp. 3-233 TaxID=3417969 RepID=UPI003D349330
MELENFPNTSDYPKPILDFAADIYPDHGKDMRRWAWEFLRRNATYQRLWDTLAQLPEEIDGAWKGHATPTGRFFIDHGYFADPEPHYGETADEYIARVGHKGRFVNFRTYIEETFKIHPEPIDWRDEFSDDFPIITAAFSEDAPAPWRLTDHIEYDNDLGAPLQDAISMRSRQLGDQFEILGFDLSMKIGPQLLEAKEVLEQIQSELRSRGLKVKNRPTFQTDLSTRYLMVLDGIASRTSENKIRARINLNGSKHTAMYNSIRTKAQQLRDTDYWRCT